jgi:hypothetical protein
MAGEVLPTAAETRTLAIRAPPEIQGVALRVLCSVVELSHMDEEGVLWLGHGELAIEGGWEVPIKEVNVDHFVEARQKGCVISFRPEQVAHIRMQSDAADPYKGLGELNAWLMSEIAKLRRLADGRREQGREQGERLGLELAYVDILYKYDTHSHLTYRQDTRPALSRW